MMQTRSRSSLAREDGDKLAKKRSASSQSDYQKIHGVTQSKEAPQHEIPQALYIYVKLALEAEQKLKTRPCDEGLLQQLSYDKEHIDIVAKHYKASGHLPFDWEYHPDTASSCVPIKCHLVAAKKKPKKNIPRNPHIDSVPLVGELEKAASNDFKKLDKKLKKTTLIGLPIPIPEEIKTRLDKDNQFVTFIGNFAVDVFNDSFWMYLNKNKSISDPKVIKCIYLKVRPCYLFYMTIEALEQGVLGVYKISLRCNLDNGAIVLDSFCLTGHKPSGMREGAIISLESIYETVKDDSKTDLEVHYEISGMVRRTKGGYDYHNPRGWDSLCEW